MIQVLHLADDIILQVQDLQLAACHAQYLVDGLNLLLVQSYLLHRAYDALIVFRTLTKKVTCNNRHVYKLTCQNTKQSIAIYTTTDAFKFRTTSSTKLDFSAGVCHSTGFVGRGKNLLRSLCTPWWAGEHLHQNEEKWLPIFAISI